jgi:hypothetical protein
MSGHTDASRLLNAQLRVTSSLSELIRAKRLRDEGLISPQMYEHAAREHAKAEAQLRVFIASLREPA